MLSSFSGKENQLWKISDSYNGLYKITNKQFPKYQLASKSPFAEGNKLGLANSEKSTDFGWKLIEVCETKQTAYKSHTIPCTIEAEDFDSGCSGQAFYDTDEVNEGGQYRIKEGVDIEVSSAGSYNIGWTRRGEWLSYTVDVKKTSSYQISFFIASSYDSGKLHLECDAVDLTGTISIPNTGGFQKWGVINKNVKLEAGQHELKLVIDGELLNIDKMVFAEMK